MADTATTPSAPRRTRSAEEELAATAAREKRAKQSATAARAKAARLEKRTRERLGEILTRGFSPHDESGRWFSWASPVAREAVEQVNSIARKCGSAESLRGLLAHAEDEAGQ